ncbi:hypothetical protein FRC03_009976 [Tulasnella sp. 419]|nr:hypothetical protein FRC03_009976 [Tulasnella sp. 419]
MLQPNDIPKFEGTESSQDAETWLEEFITATGSCSESGIFRLLKTKFPSDSPARKWYDELDGAFKKTWDDFELLFCAQWLAEAKHRAEEAAAWDVFTRHHLTSDDIFSKKTAHHAVIAEWNEEHYRLGKATNRDDSLLIAETRHLLPSFIVAYLQVHIKNQNPSFLQYCNYIHDIPSSILDMEEIRAQLASQENESAMEGNAQAFYKKMYQLVVMKSPDLEGEASIEERIVWEPCSPVTPVVSIVTPPSAETSEHLTPFAQSLPLLESSEDQGDDISNELPTEETQHETRLCVPITWRKPVATLTRKAQFAKAQRAIDFILIFNKPLHASYADNLRSALAIYDRMACSHNNEQKEIPQFTTKDDQYESLLSGLHGLYSFCTYDDLSQITSLVKLWTDISKGNPQGLRNIVTFGQREVVDEKVTSYRDSRNVLVYSKSNLAKTPSGESIYAGGLFSLGSTYNNPDISSVRTTIFMTFSSYLAECTGDNAQRETAVLSANCIKRLMLDSTTMLITDCVMDSRDEYDSTKTSTAVPSCHLTGIAIEGFCVLGSVTGEAAWTSLAVEMAIAAMRYKGWHGPNGVLSVGSEGITLANRDCRTFKGWLNRGLLVAYQRNRSNKAFCNLIRSYINVQCNALLELSSSEDSYGIHWGEAYTGPNIFAQVAAIDTLVAAIGVN